MNRVSAATITAETVVPSASARAFAASHSTSGTRTARAVPVGKTAALVCALQHADKATTLTILTQATRRDLYSMLIELAHYAQASPPTVVVRQPSTVETRPLPWHQPRHGRPRLDPPIVLDPDAPWTVDDIRRHREILDHYHPITAVAAPRVDGDFTPFTPKRALDSPSRDEASAARGAVTATQPSLNGAHSPMTLLAKPQPDTSAVRDDDELVHLTCSHNPTRAFCGADLTDAPRWHPGVQAPDCIVCQDLRKTALATTKRCPGCEKSTD